MTRIMLLAVLATGCRNVVDPQDGKQDGKTGHANFRLAPAKGVQTTDATTLLDELIYTDCDGVETRSAGGSNVDLRSGTLISLEPGDWCGLQINLQGPVVAAGVTHGGVQWDMNLEVLFITVGNGVPFKILKDRYYVFEFAEPEWFRANDLQPQDTAVTLVTIDSSHPSYSDLSGRIALNSALFEDPNGDAGIDAGERGTYLVARGPNRIE